MKLMLASVAGLLLMLAPASSSAHTISEDISVVVEPTAATVVLGEHIDIRVSVTNTGSDPTAALVSHIDITDPNESTSVDPEDWTATLSKAVGSLQPGATVTVSWRIQPISAGTYSLYAVALAPGDDTIAASNVLEVNVDDHRSLNPNGILPVAIGAPVLVGGLLVLQLRFARRTGSDVSAA